MDKYKKVIKGLECCGAKPLPKCEACPYAYAEEGTCFTMDKMHGEALALLKAQEPVKPEIGGNTNGTIGTTWFYICGACNRAIDHSDKFCRHCGREVQWDG